MTREIIDISTIAVAAVFVLGCGGSSSDGDSDCTIETADDGTITVTCGDESTTIPGTGQDGADGQAGADGTAGADGADGPAASDGADGAAGADGADGQDGATGDAGAPGRDGTDGADGGNGANGQDGEECTVVENGDGTTTQTCPDGSSNTWWTGFSGRVFYLADLDDDGYYHAYMAEVMGGAPTSYQISGEPAGAGGVDDFNVSDDGNTLVYLGDMDDYLTHEIYYVDLSGDTPAAPVRVNTPIPADSGQNIDEFVLSANGETLIYVGDQDTDDVFEAYYVDLSGASPAAPVKISGTMDAGEDVSDKNTPQVSDDGNRVVYVADQDSDEVWELYYVDLSGVSPAAPVKLSGTMVADGDVNADPALAANGMGVVYRADQDTDGVHELYYVDLSGVSPAAAVKVNSALVSGGLMQTKYLISRDSTTIIYRADQDVDNVQELFYVDISGASPAAPVQLNTSLPSGADVDDFKLSRDGNSVIYRADQDVQGEHKILYVDLSGVSPAAPVQVTDTLIAGGFITEPLLISGDGQAVVYPAIKETAGVYELYFVDLSGSAPGVNVKLNTPLPSGSGVTWAALSEDGDTVVYASDQDINKKEEIYLVSIMPNGQHTAPLKLNEPMIDTDDKAILSNIEIRPIL